VLATTALVAVVAHAVVPGLPWPAAFVLGAIVAPPDAVAATTIARRLGLPQRIVTIIEGESLVNDAASLVAYRVAVAAVVTGSFSLGSASLSFVVGGVGGVAIGVGFGFLRGLAARVLSPDAAVDNTLFLLTPYAAYLVAEQVEVSGVLAVVAAGLVVARVSSPVVGFQTRLSSLAITDLLSFVLTSLVFVLIGLQLRPVLAALPQDRLLPVLGETLLVALTVVVVRMLWVFPGMYLPRLLSAREQRPPIGGALVVGWAGMRGVVSLAAALSLPTATDSGGAFPERDVLVLITFGVILVTLVLQGLTLPALIRRTGLHDDGMVDRERATARARASAVALARLVELAEQPWAPDRPVQRLRERYTGQHTRDHARAQRLSAEASDTGSADGGHSAPPAGSRDDARVEATTRLLGEVLAAQRAALLDLRRDGTIGDEALRDVQRNLDLEAARAASRR